MEQAKTLQQSEGGLEPENTTRHASHTTYTQLRKAVEIYPDGDERGQLAAARNIKGCVLTTPLGVYERGRADIDKEAKI